LPVICRRPIHRQTQRIYSFQRHQRFLLVQRLCQVFGRVIPRLAHPAPNLLSDCRACRARFRLDLLFLKKNHPQIRAIAQA
jgi:hypothetical protein